MKVIGKTFFDLFKMYFVSIEIEKIFDIFILFMELSLEFTHFVLKNREKLLKKAILRILLSFTGLEGL